MDTRIYIHGRPQGQDIWSVNEDATDRFYLEPFLDSRLGSDVNSAMIIDVWQKHCYYTYIHCKNVTEKTVRPNAYFAITVRFDGICKNVASLYNLLDLIYNKFCLGNLVANENGQEHILVSQWKEKESVLLQINNLVLQNIEKVILPYISSIDNLKDTKDTTPQKWSLQDIDCPLFVATCEKQRVIVSPSYRSKDNVHEDDLKRVAPLEAECSKLKEQVSLWNTKYETTENARALQEKRVLELSNEIIILESKVKGIREEVENQFRDEISKLKSEKQKLEADLREAQRSLDIKQKNEDLQRRNNQVGKNPKNNFSGGSITNNNSEEIVRLMADRFPVLLQENSSKPSSIIKKVSSWLSIVNTVLLVAVICVFCFHLKQHQGNKENDQSIDSEEPVGTVSTFGDESPTDSLEDVNFSDTFQTKSDE